MNFFKGLKGFPFLAVFIAAVLVAGVVLFLERWDDRATDRTAAPESREAKTRGKGLTGETPAGKPACRAADRRHYRRYRL
jgi:hypothetical protein